jgi:molecular chaperone GrpE
MSEPSPPAVPPDPARDGQETLTPERIEAVLADFRLWLQQAAAPAEDGSEEEPLDLYSLLSQLTALRQEVNLQTRATRAQQEQNSETLRRLGEALDALRQAPVSRPPAAPEAEDALRPLLKSLVDVYDALLLAGREVQRVRETILPSLDTIVAAPTNPEPEKPRSFWSRLFAPNPPAARPAASTDAQQAVHQVRQLLDSLLTGYGMSLRRIERTLRQAGLERIECAGEPFDPERMEVLEVTPDPNRPAGEVIEEVRPGYLWNGRVFRYAQVRVARA